MPHTSDTWKKGFYSTARSQHQSETRLSERRAVATRSEGIKGGLDAELIRNRSFEEAPNIIGLSRYWDRCPDDRNDDYGRHFFGTTRLLCPFLTCKLLPRPFCFHTVSINPDSPLRMKKNDAVNYAEGVGYLQPSVASTVGLKESNDVTAKVLANVA